MVFLVASLLSTSTTLNRAASVYAESALAPPRAKGSTRDPAASVGDGRRIVAVCPQCGKRHARTAAAPTASGTVVRSSAEQGVARAIGTVSSGMARSVSSVLNLLNAQRARQGLGSLRYDPVLQAVAERRAKQMAASGQKGHPPGSFAPGRYEGVGWSSSYSPTGVSACYTSDPRMQLAGAAMATGRDGVYFAVVYR
jgi:hypothetical protein